jgi:mono/diheme cytochrome c family protein
MEMRAAGVNSFPQASRTVAKAVEKGATNNATDLAQAAGSQNPTYMRDIVPIVMGKCVRCHNEESKVLQNWLDYRTASADRLEIKRRVWDSWRGVYFKQAMPMANGPESQSMTEEERETIRKWVESGAARGVRVAGNGAQTKGQRLEAGKRIFSGICAACHQPTGQGIPGVFPPLAGSDLLNSDKHRAIGIVVSGLQGELIVNGKRFNNTMPKLPLNDEEIASALTYVYNSFGNSGKDVTPAEVSAVRLENPRPTAGQKQSTAVQAKSPFE